jgi:hypothetical protein
MFAFFARQIRVVSHIREEFSYRSKITYHHSSSISASDTSGGFTQSFDSSNPPNSTTPVTESKGFLQHRQTSGASALSPRWQTPVARNKSLQSYTGQKNNIRGTPVTITMRDNGAPSLA